MTWLPTCRSASSFPKVFTTQLSSYLHPRFIFSGKELRLHFISVICHLDKIWYNIFSSSYQGELHVSKLFHHLSILPYKSIFIAENELWVITPFMAYGNNFNCH